MTSIPGVESGRLTVAAVELAKELIRLGEKKVAVLVDEAFRSVGLEKAAIYAKSLPSLVEYPPRGYESVVAIAATSEGLTGSEIGKHKWADLAPMWNMP